MITYARIYYPPRPFQGNIKLYSGFWTWEGCIEYEYVYYIHWKTTSTRYHSAEAYVDQTQVLTHRSKPEFLWDVTTNAFARILGLYVGWLTPGWSLWNLGEVVQVECENPCNAITLSCIALIVWWFPTKKQANLKSFFFKKSWPSAATLVFQDYVFFGIYIMELVLRFCAFGPRALTEKKNMAFWQRSA